MLRLPEGFDASERVKFILACYNAGYSRIADARRLARYLEESGDEWSIVATYLELLAEPEYVELEIVHSGPFYGSAETIAYVNRVMHIYNIYRNKIIPYI
jgi:membrane-bound lytic murein transglycosylase F